VLESRLVLALQRPIIHVRMDAPARRGSVAHRVACASNTLKGAAPLSRDSSKTWQYFAQAVIQEKDPAKLTDLMEQLYRALGEDENESTEAAESWRSCLKGQRIRIDYKVADPRRER
jgi:hypothetical protein